MLTLHHLQVSQSERLIWLCEELSIPYTLRLHQRAPLMSPPSITSLHPIGAAPIIEDSGLPSPLAESAACADWIIHKHGGGRLALSPDHKDYAKYLYWYHAANGTLQPGISRYFLLANTLKEQPEHPSLKNSADRLHRVLGFYDTHLKQPENEWLAGSEFTAADVMTVFSFTTMRCYAQVDLSAYQGILGYLKRVAGREAYVTAMEKGDSEMDWRANMKGQPPASFLDKVMGKQGK